MSESSVDSITISVTIPKKVEKFFKRKSEALGTSRSRIIANVLIDFYARSVMPRVRKKG